MNSFYTSYEAYERRVIRGEFYRVPAKTKTRPGHQEPLLVKIGDLLIHTGLKLKLRHATSKPMALSLMTGSKP